MVKNTFYFTVQNTKTHVFMRKIRTKDFPLKMKKKMSVIVRVERVQKQFLCLGVCQ